MVFRYATGSKQEDIIFFQEQFLGEDLTVSWGMTVLVLKGGSEQCSTASFNWHTCDAALVPSACGRFQMLIVSLARSLLTHWKQSTPDMLTWVLSPLAEVAWQLSFQFPVSQSVSLLGSSHPSREPSETELLSRWLRPAPSRTYLAYNRSGLKKILWTLLSKCYQKERSTSLNRIHDPWQMCSVFRVAYIQQFCTTGQIISLSENMICN